MTRSTNLLRILLAFLFALICLVAFVAPSRVEADGLSRLSRPDQDAPRHRIDHDNDRAQHRSSSATQSKVGYSGGPVMAGTTSIYVIFWEPTGNVSAHYNSVVERYFNDVGSSPLYRIAHQYKQANGGYPANAVLAGVWKDTRAYRHSILLDSEIQHEVTYAQQVNGWHSSLNNLFFVLTERNENVCMDNTQTTCTSGGYCAYHSWFGAHTLYAVVPYQTSFACDYSSGPNHDDADQAIDNISHEQMEAATDPLGDGWYDADGSEIGDLCVNDFGSLNSLGANVMWNNHPYLLQKEWDNATGSCRLAALSSV